VPTPSPSRKREGNKKPLNSPPACGRGRGWEWAEGSVFSEGPSRLREGSETY